MMWRNWNTVHHVKWCSGNGKQYGGSSKNYTQNCHKIQEFHCWLYTLKNWKQCLKDIYTPMVIALFTTAKRRKATQMSMEGWRYKCVYTYNGIICMEFFKMVGNSDIRHNMDEHWDMMLSEYASHKRTNTVWFHVYEVTGVGKFRETK